MSLTSIIRPNLNTSHGTFYKIFYEIYYLYSHLSIYVYYCPWRIILHLFLLDVGFPVEITEQVHEDHHVRHEAVS